MHLYAGGLGNEIPQVNDHRLSLNIYVYNVHNALVSLWVAIK